MIRIPGNTSTTTQRERFVIDGDVWVPAALLLIAVYIVHVAVEDFGLMQQEGGLGAGMLPALAGTGLAATSLPLLLRGLLGKRESKQVDLENPSRETSHAKQWVVFGILILATGAMTALGFIIVLGLIIYTLMAWVEGAKQITALVTAIITAIFVWGVFDRFIGVPLPPGIIFS